LGWLPPADAVHCLIVEVFSKPGAGSQLTVAARPRSAATSSRGSGPGDHSRIPHASASSSRLRAGASSPGPGSAWIRLLATSRPTSRRSRFSSAFRASSSARGTLTVSDASAFTCGSPRLGDLNPSLDRGVRRAEDVTPLGGAGRPALQAVLLTDVLTTPLDGSGRVRNIERRLAGWE
jgi:hypothetical protein